MQYVKKWLKSSFRIVPAAVLFLIPGKILEAENITLMISNLGLYVLVVFAGLFIHSLIVLPLLYFICTRKSPYSLLLKTGPAIITALGTSSRFFLLIIKLQVATAFTVK